RTSDPATGNIRDLTLRGDNGGPASFTELRGENERLWREHHGSLNPELVKKLMGLAGGDEVHADLWLRVPGDGSFITNTTTPEMWDLAHTAWLAQRHAAALPIANSVAGALTGAGATVLSTELTPPVLHIRASRNV